jgi:putative transcriptional regulator
MGKKYRSDALAAVHETALGLTEAGVMDKRTMKAFDEMCLTPVKELTAKQIRQIRMREKASQAVFARYLNVTTGLVSQWERGEICVRPTLTFVCTATLTCVLPARSCPASRARLSRVWRMELPLRP